jgi:hypothetical protein
MAEEFLYRPTSTILSERMFSAGDAKGIARGIFVLI